MSYEVDCFGVLLPHKLLGGPSLYMGAIFPTPSLRKARSPTERVILGSPGVLPQP